MKPDHWPDLLGATLDHYRHGRTDQALALLHPALKAPQVPSEAWNLAALIHLRRQSPRDARAAAKRATAAKDSPGGHFNTLGLAYEAEKDYPAAIIAYGRACERLPQVATFRYNLGNALMKAGQHDKALPVFLETVRLDPTFAASWNNAGLCCKLLGRYQESETHFRQAIALRPDYPQALYNLGTLLLLIGRPKEGWPLYDTYRWHLATKPEAHSLQQQPRWQGAPFAGQTLKLWTEQGFGDNLQFIRYAPRLAALGGRVILECTPPLIPLLARMDGIAALYPTGQVEEAVEWHLPVTALPALFDWHPEDPVNAAPYLSAPPERVPLPSGSGLKVGLTWAGNVDPDPFRTCPLEQLRPLLDVQDVTFYSLQTGDIRREMGRIPPARRPILLSFSDFSETAGWLSQLDLLITIDTSMAHLAGGLGLPTWVMLPHRADWRWLLDRDDSPWYPSLRLFRQSVQGQWKDVVERLVSALTDLRDRHRA